MAHLVKLLTYDDGDIKVFQKWCLVDDFRDSPRTVCSGEAFGKGESGCEYEEKKFTIKDVTCETCKEIIGWYKSLK